MNILFLEVGVHYGYVTIVTSQHIRNRNLFLEIFLKWFLELFVLIVTIVISYLFLDKYRL